MTQSEHPFSSSLSDLTSDELERRYSELMSRWGLARRMNMGQQVLHQLDMLIVSVESERDRRRTIDDRPSGTVLDTDPIQINLPYPRKT